MNIDNLKEKYIKLTKICSETYYTDKNSIRKNNSAVNEMYKIIELISEKNNQSEIKKFSELLNITENRTNIWAATHMLEKIKVDKKMEKLALKIIKKVAKGNGTDSLGYQSWLSNYKSINNI
jgi:hypothetical protein